MEIARRLAAHPPQLVLQPLHLELRTRCLPAVQGLDTAVQTAQAGQAAATAGVTTIVGQRALVVVAAVVVEAMAAATAAATAAAMAAATEVAMVAVAGRAAAVAVVAGEMAEAAVVVTTEATKAITAALAVVVPLPSPSRR